MSQTSILKLFKYDDNSVADLRLGNPNMDTIETELEKKLEKTATASDSAKLGGVEAALYLLAASTAANSAKLGGVPALSYLLKSDKASDSNLLDGHDSNYFLPASAYTNDDVLAKLKSLGSPVPGLNSDTLDDKHANDFLSSEFLSGRVLTDLNLANATRGVTINHYPSDALNRPPIITGGSNGAVFTMSYIATFAIQIAGDWKTNDWHVRTHNGTDWLDWQRLFHSGYYGRPITIGSDVLLTADYDYSKISAGSSNPILLTIESGHPEGAEIYIQRTGTGTVTIATASGVTIKSIDNKRKIKDVNGAVILEHKGNNVWGLVGSLE